MEFLNKLGKIINSKQTSSVMLSGNVLDLFLGKNGYIPLTQILSERATDFINVTYKVHESVFVNDDEFIKDFIKFRGYNKKDFENDLLKTINSSSAGLELLRQFTLCSRQRKGKPLQIIIENADALFPMGQFSSLQVEDRKRIAIAQNWLTNYEFLESKDFLIFLADSVSAVHEKITSLPQLLQISVPTPDYNTRLRYIKYFCESCNVKAWDKIETLAEYTASLTIHSLRQLLIENNYTDKFITPEDVIVKVEEYIQSQLGDMAEFSKPNYKLDKVIGCSKVKKFFKDELIPRILSSGDECPSGILLSGPIGGGKTFIAGALAAELNVPNLVLKNLRSQWFGQTDVKLEKLKMIISGLGKVNISVDEADTQFGGLGKNAHETEQRLTGKIQAMMSDPTLKGKVVWILMTARVNRLSPDIRRPGRCGDFIIPILDPEGQDKIDFIKWATELDEESSIKLDLKDFSAADFSQLRSNVKSNKASGNVEKIAEIVYDTLRADIQETREHQTLEALINCSKRSLLPEQYIKTNINETKKIWKKRIEELDFINET